MADLWRLKGSQFFDSSGNPLASGTLNYYDAGTTSARTVYQDEAATVPWTQPITLDSAGRLTASIYILTGDFKEVLATSAAVNVYTEDNIPGADGVVSGDFASFQAPIISKAANYTVTTDDIGSYFTADPTGGTFTLTLPDAALVASGRGVFVSHVGTANSVTVDGNGAQTINGAANLSLGIGDFAVVVSDGSNWSAMAGDMSTYMALAGGTMTGALELKAAIDVASATTTDIGALTGNIVRITGTTTITGLGTAAAGVWRLVRFAGALTLTHNGTSLILPGGMNITTVAGDTGLFVSEGSGNWRGYSYQKAAQKAALVFIIDGGGVVITTGVKGDLEIPFRCTITQATMLADQSGSIVVDIWKDTYANYPPTDADSITASAPPTITTATKSQDSTLTGWTTAISSGDVLRFNVDSITTVQRVTVTLQVTKL